MRTALFLVGLTSITGCTEVQPKFLPWLGAPTLYTRVCDIPRQQESLGKTVRIRGRYFTDHSTHDGFFDTTCSGDSGNLIFLTNRGNGDKSVSDYWDAVKNDCPSVCLTEMQLDVSGTLVLDKQRRLHLDMTHVHLFNRLP